ncbi:OprO/OprP family phosphate-selective porin [Microbulbifer litoralis]|uniref:OprO/OprP family phosphate-selective porin n=1 Tax=Microbulbifer litoralis TaxID=2933965 RepID=UPI0020294054
MKHCRHGICVLVGAVLFNTASADQAETRGDLEITSDDGNFSAKIGGRIHFDTYLFDPDIEDPVSTTEFRRARISLSGKAWGWKYKLEQDFAAGDTLSGFRDAYIAHDFFGGTVKIGSFKPYRSMDEMTSSNELTVMERSFSSGSGIYDGRQRQQGIGWHDVWNCTTFGLMGFNTRDPAGPRNEGVGAAGRFTWAPIDDDLSTVHFGISASHENPNRDSDELEATADYAGRRGPTQLIALTPGDRSLFFGDYGDEFFYFGDDGGDVNIAGLELAGTYGPLYAQAEYAYAEYDGDYSISEAVFEDWFDAPPGFDCDPFFGCFIGDQDVHTWYIMGSWMITGEHKPYDLKKGAFESAKPRSDWGAWELTARYDTIENRDIPNLEANSTIIGVNYYHNPQVRFMVNLVFGDDEFTGDETKQLAIRAQMSW